MAAFVPLALNFDFAITVDFGRRALADINVNADGGLEAVIQNAHELETSRLRNEMRRLLGQVAAHYNEAFSQQFQREARIQARIGALEASTIQMQNTNNQQQEALNHLNAENQALRELVDQGQAGAGNAQRLMKLPDPPTYSGSNSKSDLEGWLNHIVLFTETQGITSDKQRIIAALTRLREPASGYMKSYFDNVRNNVNLGTWDAFVAELKTIYGRKDEEAGAKDEIAKLWDNKDLARKDLVKYVEHYRTLARIVNYPDNIHIDKLRQVVPQDVRQALVGVELAGQIPDRYQQYLETVLNIYKMLHPEKTKGTIFSSGGGKNPDAMDVDTVGKGKQKQASSAEAKPKKFCKWCQDNGNKRIANTHNTVDCRKKSGASSNSKTADDRKPTVSPSKSGNKNEEKYKKKYQQMKARFMKDELDSSDSEQGLDRADIISIAASSDFIPSPKIRTARIETLPDSFQIPGPSFWLPKDDEPRLMGRYVPPQMRTNRSEEKSDF